MLAWAWFQGGEKRGALVEKNKPLFSAYLHPPMLSMHVTYCYHCEGPVAQLVERWTPCGESTRPGYESLRVRGATGARYL